MTLLSDLLAEGLPVINVSPTLEVSMNDMTEDQYRIYEAVLLHYHYPGDYPDLVQIVKFRLELKNNFDVITQTLLTYSLDDSKSVPEIIEQLNYVTGLLYKLMMTYRVPITTQKE